MGWWWLAGLSLVSGQGSRFERRLSGRVPHRTRPPSSWENRETGAWETAEWKKGTKIEADPRENTEREAGLLLRAEYVPLSYQTTAFIGRRRGEAEGRSGQRWTGWEHRKNTYSFMPEVLVPASVLQQHPSTSSSRSPLASADWGGGVHLQAGRLGQWAGVVQHALQSKVSIGVQIAQTNCWRIRHPWPSRRNCSFACG